MKFSRRYFVMLITLLFVGTALPSQAAQPPGTQPATAPRVLIISIDGCRPDMLLRADAPNVRSLMAEGSFTFWARTTAVSVTLPSHTSMLTGVTPLKHGIDWNRELPFEHPVYPKFPTIFEIAHRAGYTTAMAAGKAKFATLGKPGTIDFSYVPAAEKEEDEDVAYHAVEIIRDHRPQVMFVHLPSTDNVGHAIGWGTPEQLRTIEQADRQIGRLLSALEDVGLRHKTFILITADHGGAGRAHGPDDPRCRHIPWIAAGPGVRHNLDLTTFPDLTVHTEDTFATACRVLKLPLNPQIDGRPVDVIFNDPQRELLTQSR
jgi:arylsulfatase A-like enzyme